MCHVLGFKICTRIEIPFTPGNVYIFDTLLSLRSYHRVATFSLWFFRAFRLFAYSRPHLLGGGTQCMYVAGVGRNGDGSDCRIAFCFAAGVVASDQTPHLVVAIAGGDLLLL